MYQRPDGLFEKIVTIDGRRVAFRGKTEKEVTHKMLAYQEKKELGRTFQEVAEEWQELHWSEIQPTTAKGYLPAYKRAIEHFDNTPVNQITPININVFINQFAKLQYAQKTVRTQLLVINMILEFAVVQGDLQQNPAQYLSIPKNLKKKRREVPTESDIETVEKSLDCTFGLFAYFLLYTGCRRGEALALQYKDINRKDKIIRINKSVYYVNNVPNLKVPKTEAGVREIVLIDKLMEKLPKGKKDDYLFPGTDGKLITESAFFVKWRKYCRETGLDITPHQLRHAYATALFNIGIDPKDAQDLLGHANIATTQDIYTHITKSRKEKVKDILNNM